MDVKLIATDLDGTLIRGVRDFHLYTEFRDIIDGLRRDYDALWVICTGRDRSSFHRFFAPMSTMGIRPDLIILKHAYIYTRSSFGYIPHMTWNLCTRALLWSDRLNVRRAIGDWQRAVAAVIPEMTTIQKSRNRLWLRFDSEEAAAMAWDILRERAAEYRHLRPFKYLKEVDVRAVPFTKGLAVRELAKHLGVGPQKIMTIGNGHNDISMFEPDVALLTGCPANSEPEVIRAVHERGGHIASEDALKGVMEIFHAYRSGTVSSALPATWQDPTRGDNPSRPRSRHRSHRRRLAIRTRILIGLSAYTVITVFASLEMIPFVSGLIMKPYLWMVTMIQKLVYNL